MSSEEPSLALVHRWRVESGTEECRLDRHVARHLDVPRNRVQGWIRQQLVSVDGAPAKASATLRVGAEVRVSVPAAVADGRVEPEPGALCVLYEDDELVVLDKPAGLTVHPGAGRSTGTLAHRLVRRYPEMAGVGGTGRPGIVHRLDLGTSGVIVVARSDSAYRWLSECFARRRAIKEYLAIAWGIPHPEHRRIELPIGRHPSRRKEMTVRVAGRPAITDLQVIASRPAASLLHLDLRTGRTHQIRVHLKAIGHPLIGDPVYGEERWKGQPRPLQRPTRSFPRPALHAWRLTLPRPGERPSLKVEAAPPTDLRELWLALGGHQEDWLAATLAERSRALKPAAARRGDDTSGPATRPPDDR